jgi:hypothetical protein
MCEVESGIMALECRATYLVQPIDHSNQNMELIGEVPRLEPQGARKEETAVLLSESLPPLNMILADAFHPGQVLLKHWSSNLQQAIPKTDGEQPVADVDAFCAKDFS